MRLSIPGFAELGEASAPALPVKRQWVEAIAGRKVELVSVRARDVEAFTSLRPSQAAMPELVASRDGTVRALNRRARTAFRGEGLSPSSAARLLEVGFQGEVKKALVELAPLRWDGTRGQLLLARRLVVRVSFRTPDPSEEATRGRRGRRYRRRRSHDERSVAKRLAAVEPGLYAVRYEDVMSGSRSVPARSLRLSRQGKAVAFHLEPNRPRFQPGSTLYFMSEGASLNPYGNEAVYELEMGRTGARMQSRSAAPSGGPTTFYMKRVEQEQNRYYQAALTEKAAPDLWLWDLLFAPVTKSYPFEVSALASTTDSSSLTVWLQGVTDFEADPDHHVRVYVNGSLVGESSWDGKTSRRLDVALLPGVLVEGENTLEVENVGDTGAAYSMVLLDRFALSYPRVPVADNGELEGVWKESGTAEVSGLGPEAHVLELSRAHPRWLSGVQNDASRVRFRAESGETYYAVSAASVRRPEVRAMPTTRLKSRGNRAEYLLVGQRAFLGAATPLLKQRRQQGLKVKSVALEDVYAEFGFGETSPEALREFLRYAYHNWRRPSLRYVVLLGDATYDFKDYLETGIANQVPPLIVKTTYMWTASDPAYAAVNGEDLLPDIALGRLAASSVGEAEEMVAKILGYERGDATLSGRVVLVADNADTAGNFEANASTLTTGVLASRPTETIALSELGTAATREAILQSFDGGASIVSYIGHGGIVVWASENVFNYTDVASLSSQAQQPILLTMNCLNGFFHLPTLDSLSEELVKATDKGAIAAFSPSGLSVNDPAHRFHQALLRELVDGNHERLGDAVLAAQEAYAETGAFPELLSIYNLFGDPAMTLR